MGEARRRKLTGTMPEKTARHDSYCDLCRKRLPRVPSLFERPAVATWPAVQRPLYVCRVCQIELDGARMAFPGDDATAERYRLRMQVSTGRPWAWHREPAHPRLFFLEEGSLHPEGPKELL